MTPLLDTALDGLGWAVKQTFVQYVNGLPDGRITPVSGAVIDSSWGFVFPLASADFDSFTGAGRLEFAGGVKFQGHLGMLRLDLLRPTLILDERRGHLLTSDDRGQHVLATVEYEFRTTSHEASWIMSRVALVESAVPDFGGAYRAGEQLDAFAISLQHGGQIR